MRKSPVSCIQESLTSNSVILTSGPNLKAFWMEIPLTESTERISPPFSTSICKVVGNSTCPYPVEWQSGDEKHKFPSSNWMFNVEGFVGKICLRDLVKMGLSRLPFPQTESFYMSKPQQFSNKQITMMRNSNQFTEYQLSQLSESMDWAWVVEGPGIKICFLHSDLSNDLKRFLKQPNIHNIHHEHQWLPVFTTTWTNCGAWNTLTRKTHHIGLYNKVDHWRKVKLNTGSSIIPEDKPFSSRLNKYSWSCQIHLCQENSL